jgi:tetratricopeptide (TPR) repeat protein
MFYVTLALAVGWVMLDSFLVDNVTVRLCADVDQGIPPEKRMPVFLDQIASDGYAWNNHAENIGKDGSWRMRWTHLDNAPNGRELHWNSAFAWYLRGLGEIYHANTGESLRNSIFRMSIWANPILLVVALIVFSTLSAKRFGPLCGTILVMGMVLVPTFYEGFMPAYPDHHGILAFALMGLFFGIAWAGVCWVKPEGDLDITAPNSLKQARQGMIFSAVSGAAAIWISALSTSIVLGTIGIAAVVSALFMKRKGRGACVHHAELWKLWALWGSGSAMLFYLFEYFPSHMGMRLEVNHPFYAMAWLGGGWMISILTGWILDEDRERGPFPLIRMILPFMACLVLPLAILIGGAEVYIPKDPFMARLWGNITELLTLAERMKYTGLTLKMAFGWYPLFLVAAIALLAMRGPGHGTKAVLVFLVVPIFFMIGLQTYQSRWGMLLGPIYIALAAILIPQIWRMLPQGKPVRVTAIALLLAFSWLFIQPAAKQRFSQNWEQYRTGKYAVNYPQALALIHRQMAGVIAESAGDKPVVLLSSPNSSVMLGGLGGFRTVGTLYWENVYGLKNAAKALNAQSEDDALEQMRALGVTHISMMPWENFIEPYFNILNPEPKDGQSFLNSFGKRALFDRSIPYWARPLIYPPNNLTQGLQQNVLMLQVAPNQSLAEAKFHLARFVRLVAGDANQAEGIFKDVLKDNPNVSLVRLELCDLYLSSKKYKEAIDQLLIAFRDADPATRENITNQVANVLVGAGERKLQAELVREVAGYANATGGSLLTAAWTLSTLPDSAMRDPKFALAACARAEKIPHDAATLLLVRSVAQAASGDFTKAAATIGDPALSEINNPQLRSKIAELREAFQARKLPTQ